MWITLVSLVVAAGCTLLPGGRLPAPAVHLFRAPPAASAPGRLVLQPRAIAVPLGQTAVLRLRGADVHRVTCTARGDVVSADGGMVRVPSPADGRVVEVACRADGAVVHGQVTFDDAVLEPGDPYAGGLVLFKLRREPRAPRNPAGTRETGIASLDARLRLLDAWLFPAFPFDRSGLSDRVGLSRWVVIDLPEQVNFFQAVALLREDPAVHAQSYLPEDAAFLRVQRRGTWPSDLLEPRPERLAATRSGGPRLVRHVDASRLGAPGWAARAIGAPRVWSAVQGEGVGIAVIDTGVDTNHLGLSASLRAKPDERAGGDADGNGVPGDADGVNLAHLAVVRGPGRPSLALGLQADLSDWHAAGAERAGERGHGTVIAALAAGPGEVDLEPGVAPASWIVAVDVEENLRPAESPLIEADPRQRRALDSALRTPAWSLAAGVVYAAAERARILTCAWPRQDAHWILHDALLFAEDNCVLAICAASDESAFPIGWDAARARAAGHGAGALRDAWTGSLEADFFSRPLRGVVAVGDATTRSRADVVVPTRRDGRGVRVAVPNPRNDATPLPDRRTALRSGSAVAVGLAAGAAALAVERRPDLEPATLRDALREAGRERGSLWLPDLIHSVDAEPRGRCGASPVPPVAEGEPFWKRIKLKARYGIDPGGPDGPVGWPPDEQDGSGEAGRKAPPADAEGR